MKILLLANKCSGLLSFRKEVVEALVAIGHEVTVSVPYDKRISELKELGCMIDSVEIDRRGMNPISDLKLLRYYFKIIRRVRPDVVLSYTIKPNIYGGIACAALDTPYIPNITGLGTAVEKPGLLQKFTVTLYKYALRNASCIFFQNKGNQEFFANRSINNGAHRIIPGSGVNLTKFIPADYPTDRTIRFIFISRIMKEKGIDDYIAAAEHFRKIRSDVEFHILGDFEENYAATLKDLENRNIVIYHGRQNDVRPYLKNASCLIHPTFYPEGMSNVILEAAATARPVITTRRHGCMEAVDDGITGYLFNERDRNGLLSSIDKFLKLDTKQRIRMGRNGRTKMEREFDRQIVVNAYIDEISRACRLQ